MKYLIALLAILMTTSCVKHSGGQSSPPVEKPVPVEPPAPSPGEPIRPEQLDIAVAEVTDPAGCLNLAKLYEKFRSLPGEGVIRRTSRSVDLLPNEGEAPQQEFATYQSNLEFGIFESSLSDHAKTLPAVAQNGCSAAELFGGEEGKGKYEIEFLGADPSSVELKAGTRKIKFALTGPRELVITRRSERLDTCTDSETFPVESTVVLRWGLPEELAPISERLSRSFLKTVADARPFTPAAVLQKILNVGESPDEIEMTAEDLRQLLASPVDTRTVDCQP